MPDEYRRLEARGLFTNATTGDFSGFCKPGSYLWLHDMQWYSLEDIAGFEFQSYHLPGFVPFAFTGGGDYWCWQAENAVDRIPRVLLCHRDSEFATIYAPNFHTALFSQILDFCRSAIKDGDVDVAALLRRWAIDLSEVFPASWIANLSQLAEVPNRHDLASSIERARSGLSKWTQMYDGCVHAKCFGNT